MPPRRSTPWPRGARTRANGFTGASGWQTAYDKWKAGIEAVREARAEARKILARNRVPEGSVLELEDDNCGLPSDFDDRESMSWPSWPSTGAASDVGEKEEDAPVGIAKRPAAAASAGIAKRPAAAQASKISLEAADALRKRPAEGQAGKISKEAAIAKRPAMRKQVP